MSLQLKNDCSQEVENEKKLFALRDQTFYNGFLLAWRDFEKYLAQTRTVARSPELSALIERIGALHAGYQTLFDEEAALRRSGAPYVAFRYRTMKEDAANALSGGQEDRGGRGLAAASPPTFPRPVLPGPHRGLSPGRQPLVQSDRSRPSLQ